jgi:hypothetical protein
LLGYYRLQSAIEAPPAVDKIFHAECGKKFLRKNKKIFEKWLTVEIGNRFSSVHLETGGSLGEILKTICSSPRTKEYVQLILN